ncbi:hypothetical protein CEXT_53491 [Caerostris extrusa]|uniref:Uncharacterized protein n=1 Tax=Caerostris extrusa TaxID=172846 RepID=A0AAV4TRF9_CAEEX|nr:hypothetical protein CEXT_53491 [Caerostris extrusa]
MECKSFILHRSPIYLNLNKTLNPIASGKFFASRPQIPDAPSAPYQKEPGTLYTMTSLTSQNEDKFFSTMESGERSIWDT